MTRSTRLRRALFAAAFLVLPFTLVLSGCDSGGSGMDEGGGDDGTAPNETIDATITVTNQSTVAWEVTGVSGESDVTSTDTENPSFSLTVGNRYRIENNGGNSHPFALEDANENYLLRQEDGENGSLEDNANINYVEDNDGITFTFTQTLADEVATYQCTVHSQMEGDFQTDGSDSGGVSDQVSYDLSPQNNSGVSGTVTFWRAGPDSSLVTLDLDESATDPSVSHPAHIHVNSASEGGGIEYYLSAVNGSSPNGTTARKIGESIEFFADFDGHVNVHASPANLGNVVAQGDIGANAEGTDGQGLDFVNSPRTETYPLNASTTEGSVLSDGITGTVRLEELTGSQTLVTYSLDTDGSVNDYMGSEVTVAQIGHIHKNTVSEGGGVVSEPFSGYLGSVAPTDPAARSSRIINASFDDLTGYDGYVNIHQSNANSQYVFAQGNIGANEGSGTTADATITVQAQGTAAWEVTGVSGESGIASTGTENPSFSLTVGNRYRVENDAGVGAHPFALETGTDGDYLLNQDGNGSFESDADVNYVEDNDGITFTFTQTLADEVAAYQCTFHPSMEGAVQTDGSGSGGGSY